jgi:Trk-type K+ transport system membrane component
LLWWLSIIGGVTVVILIWGVTTVPVDMMMGIVDDSPSMQGRGNDVLGTISRYWNIAPRILIIGLIAFGFLRVLKREGVQYQR